MDCLVTDIIREAKVAIDENVSSQALTALGDVDTLTLDDIIASKVEDAARLVLESAAHWLLGAGKALTGPVAWESQEEGYGAGRIVLPGDFLRLLTFQMSDWARPVTEAITEESPLYAMQSSRYGGIRGNAQRPVVAITHSHDTGLALEFYSCEAGPGVTIKRALYIGVPTITGGVIVLPDKLRSAVVYRVASMSAESIGDGNLAMLLLSRSNELAGLGSGPSSAE